MAVRNLGASLLLPPPQPLRRIFPIGGKNTIQRTPSSRTSRKEATGLDSGSLTQHRCHRLLSTNPAATSQPPPRGSADSRRVSDMLPSQSTSLFVVISSHWTDISCVWFVWARSIFELDVKGDIPYECDRAANRRPCGVLRSGNHCCLLAHGNWSRRLQRSRGGGESPR